MPLLLCLRQLLYFEVHSGGGEWPGHQRPSVPPPTPPTFPPAAPLGLCLLMTLSLLGPALPLGLHVLEHGLREAQIP